MAYDVATLTPDQERFLESYCPKDDWCTTTDEMQSVEHALFGERIEKNLLQPMRNAVVLFYSKLCKDEREKNGHSDRAYDLQTALMSVTAIIDHRKINAGLPV